MSLSQGTPPSAPPALRATLCEDPGRDERLRSGWRDLAVARANPFLTPEWFDAWSAAGATCDPRVVAVHRGPELVGVVPLVQQRAGASTRLMFAGSELGDCFHPASREEHEEPVAAAAGKVLGRGDGWSSIDLRNALRGSGWQERLVGTAGADGPRSATQPQVLPFIDFGGLDWDGFLAARSRNFRKALWRQMRRLSQRGEVTFRLADENTLDADLERFFQLHAMRWGKRSEFINPRAVGFHRLFARSSLERGWLRLGNLELDGTTIASTYGWRLGERFSEFQRGYDSGVAQLSPGKLVMGEMLRTLNEEGARIYDQLVGDEDYKFQVADGVREVETFRAGRPRTLSAGQIRAVRAARAVYARSPEPLRNALRKGRRRARSAFRAPA
jgi:CelD/BcsL family acetyltransferase involved in cellulose biosynthesis